MKRFGGDCRDFNVIDPGLAPVFIENPYLGGPFWKRELAGEACPIVGSFWKPNWSYLPLAVHDDLDRSIGRESLRPRPDTDPIPVVRNDANRLLRAAENVRRSQRAIDDVK